MTDHSSEGFNSIGNHRQVSNSELEQRVWGVIYEEGSVLTDLTYDEAVAALTQPPNGTHAAVVSNETAIKFMEAKKWELGAK